MNLARPSGLCDNFGDMNHQPFSEVSNNNFGDNSNLVNTRLFSLLSESNNTSFHDCGNDFVNSDTSFSEYDDNFKELSILSYQYNLYGFGYQAFRNDKDQNNPDISHQKSYCYSSGGVYETRKVSDISARYRHFSNKMIQDIKFFLECKVAPITQLEILKKKYPQHMFYRQDMYNAIYKLRQNDNERSDSVSLLDSVFWMLASQQKLYRQFSDVVLNDNTLEDELSSMYIWILQYLLKTTNNVVPKSFWTDSEPGLITLESSSEHTIQANVTLQTFSIAKTVINIVLETKSDNELIQLLKTFILTKQNSYNKNDNSEEAKSSENNLNSDSIITLQQDLIEQTNDPHITKIRGAPSKKKIKSAIELSIKKNVMCETTNIHSKQENHSEESSSRPQHKCLLYRTSDHYQKKYPNIKEN
ncbi:6160_t:CDS:2 [Racocetra persica]|uniref:6160_t:CDS:1 n=1 Tax=Racocetra persica TaxID=160502 RepID=A0ACA9KSM3_9GLOM|nr:6160_t:CDS:2 [Racocetra persica]